MEQQVHTGISDSWRRRRAASGGMPLSSPITDIRRGPADSRRSRMAAQKLAALSKAPMPAAVPPRALKAKTAPFVNDVHRPVQMQRIVKPQPAPVSVEAPTPATVLPKVREAPTPARTKLLHHLRLSSYSRPQLALFGLAGLIFVVGVAASFMTFRTNHAVVAQVHALSAKTTTGNQTNDQAPPSETKPSTTARNYAVAPTLPKMLTIPKLKVNARVVQLNVTKTGDLQAPTNIYDTGWYKASAKPGDGPGSGAMLIDGHVHGPTLPGVFMNIKKLVAGDTITITRGDGQKFNYVVIKTQNYDANTIDMGMVLTSIQPGKAGLNLMTCGGPYDQQSGHYTQRTVVFAVQA